MNMVSTDEIKSYISPYLALISSLYILSLYISLFDSFSEYKINGNYMYHFYGFYNYFIFFSKNSSMIVKFIFALIDIILYRRCSSLSLIFVIALWILSY